MHSVLFAAATGQIGPTTILRVANPDCLELVKTKSNILLAMLKPVLNIAVQLLVCCNPGNVSNVVPEILCFNSFLQIEGMSFHFFALELFSYNGII